MSTPPVSVPTYSAGHDKRFGPAMIEHRTAEAGLSELGSYFMVYDGEHHTDPWTLEYEETIYVIEGCLRLLVVHDDGHEESVIGDVGELVALAKGTTVRYGADIGTRLLLSISPVNWRDRS